MIKKKQKLNKKFLKKEYFTQRGRIALSYALQILKLNKENKILLPSYIGLSEKEGSGVFDPIRQLKIGYEFYTLNDDLSINKESFTEKIKQDKIKAALIIHYFGFCQKNFDYVLKTCKENKKYLIEDCAHAFNSFYKNKKLGAYGDISFYSIHKFLSTNDGGILLINNDKIKIQKKIDDRISKRTFTILYKSDIEKISQIRRNNYTYILEKIKDIKGVHPFYRTLLDGVTPINFPVIIEQKDRNNVYFELQKRKIEAVSLYHTLIPQIKKDEYPISHQISSRILNLPIHEEISKKDIDMMLRELNKILKDD